MSRWLWLGCFVLCLTATASGEEYVLHLDTVGYIDQPAAAEAPKETTIRSIEVLVQPNQPFRMKLQSGKETITFSGKFEPSKDKNIKSDFTIAIKYLYEFDSGARVAVAKNRTKPVPDITSFNTTLGINVNEPINATEFITAGNKQPGKPLKSKVRFVLVLKRHISVATQAIRTKHKA